MRDTPAAGAIGMNGPFYFIVNPWAGRGRTSRVWPALARFLEARGCEFRAVAATDSLTPMHLAERAPEGWVVAAVGGDGTMSQVIAALPPGRTAGIIPTGNTRDFARSVGYSSSPFIALRQLLEGEPRPFDVPAVNGRPFLNVAGVGFDAFLARRAEAVGWRASIGYFSAFLRRLATYRSPSLTVQLDGRAGEGCVFQLAVGNCRYYGGGLQVCPKAHFDDGLLDVCITEALSPGEALLALRRLARGTHVKHRKVHYTKAHCVRVDGPTGTVVHADGNPVGTLPATFTVRPRALQLVVPKGTWNPGKVIFIHQRRLPVGGAETST